MVYRLQVLPLHVPPLWERPEDIPPLVHDLLARHARRAGTAAPTVSAEAMRALTAHPWTGTVRERSNVLERALILDPGPRLERDHLPPDVRAAAGPSLALADAVARFEAAHIRLGLRLTDGHRQRAAKERGVSPATLYRRLHDLKIRA